MNTMQKFYRWLRRPNKSTAESWIETLVIIIPIAFVIRTFFYGLYQVPTGSMETTMLVGERFLADKFTVWIWPIERGEIITFNDPSFEYSDNAWKRKFELYVWGPSNWTKRVIGIPGDHVRGVIEDGKPVVYVNDKKLEEPYTNKYPLIAQYTGDISRPISSYRTYDPAYPYDQQPFYHMDADGVKIAQRILVQSGQKAILEPGTSAFSNEGRNVDEFDIHLNDHQYWAMGDNRLGSLDSRFWGPLERELIHGKIVFRLWSLDSDESWWIWDLLRHPIDFWSRVRWSRFFQRVT